VIASVKVLVSLLAAVVFSDGLATAESVKLLLLVDEISCGRL